MQWLLDFFDWFYDLFNQLFDFLSSIIEDFILLFKYISISEKLATEVITNLPTPVKIFGTITITVSIVYLILGRSTGGQKSGGAAE